MLNEPMFEIKEEKSGANYGNFIISPLEQGYGDTLGNSIRRVLLTSLAGAGVVSVKIVGVKHQFSTLSGMKEDVVEFILNLKKVRFSTQSFLEKPVKGKISVKEAGEVKAKDITLPAGVKVANPELILATLSKGAKLEAEMEIAGGVGYSPSEDRAEGGIGVIPMDVSFSPVSRVNYKVEETRVGRFTNYDKLTLEIWTDGTVSPKDALFSSAKILVSYFTQVISPKKRAKTQEKKEVDTLGAVGKLSVEEIGLPTRVANALGKAGYETVSDLIKAKKEDLTKVRNLGEKSIKIIAIALAQKGVKFGE